MQETFEGATPSPEGEEPVEVYMVYVKWKTGENPWLFFNENDAIEKYEQIKAVAEEEGEAVDLRMFGGVPVYPHSMTDWSTVTAHARWRTKEDYEAEIAELQALKFEEFVGSDVTRELVDTDTVCGNCGGKCSYTGYRRGGVSREFAVCTSCGSALEM